MPELPEVEIMSRRLTQWLQGERVTGVGVPGVSVLRSFEPQIDSLEGRHLLGVRRRGKHLIADFDQSTSLLVHLMSAGRLQLFGKQASRKDRSVRLTLRFGNRELRLREFGTRRRAWAKLLPTSSLESEDALSSLGPEAWPDPPPFEKLLGSSRPLHSLLRDQKVISGLGRSWTDEVLHEAELGPFKRGDSLSSRDAGRLRGITVETLTAAIEHYEREVKDSIPDKLPMPLKIHRHEGEPCPRCGTKLEAVFYDSHTLCYCPECQTAGKLLKDRRLSRLLK